MRNPSNHASRCHKTGYNTTASGIAPMDDTLIGCAGSFTECIDPVAAVQMKGNPKCVAGCQELNVTSFPPNALKFNSSDKCPAQMMGNGICNPEINVQAVSQTFLKNRIAGCLWIIYHI
jgi:hypothetical protein